MVGRTRSGGLWAIVLVAGLTGVLIAPARGQTGERPSAPAGAEPREGDPEAGNVRPDPDVADPMLSAGVLEIGEAAPALGVLEWLDSGAVDVLEKGRIGVIGFWVPGTPGGRDGGRVLTVIRRAWPEDVRIAYIAALDEAGGVTLESTREFVEAQGTALEVPIAVDAAGKTVAAYLEAAGITQTPYVFVVDREGVVVWHGSPLSEQVAGVLDLVRRGEWDWREYKRISELEARAGEILSRAQEAWHGGDHEGCVALLQEGFELDTSKFADYAVWKFHALHVGMGESERAYEYARSLIEGPLKDNAEALSGLAWVIVEAPPERAYDDITAEMAVRRAMELTGEQHGAAWGALAIIQTRRENYEDALVSWERALAFVPSDEVELVYLRKQAETQAAYDEARRMP